MPLKRLQDHRARSDHRVICLRAHACDRAQARFFGETSMHGVQHVTDDECPIGDNHPLRRLCRPGLLLNRGRAAGAPGQHWPCVLHPQ